MSELLHNEVTLRSRYVNLESKKADIVVSTVRPVCAVSSRYEAHTACPLIRDDLPIEYSLIKRSTRRGTIISVERSRQAEWSSRKLMELGRKR